MMNNWVLLVALHLFFATAYNQGYKKLADNMEHPGALTILIELTAGISCFLLMPFYDMTWPKHPGVYVFLILACVFYALNDRLCTTVRQGMDSSVYTIIKQFSTVFMILAGLFFFKEDFVWTKTLGAFLIVFSNIIVFFQHGKLRLDKHVMLGLLASLFASIALFLDVSYSEQFNLAFYTGFIFVVPALFIIGAERLGPQIIRRELSVCNKKCLLITAVSSAIMTIVKLAAFQVGQVIVVAPLCSLIIMTNILFEMIVLGEKNDLAKKFIAGLIILFSIWLIQL